MPKSTGYGGKSEYAKLGGPKQPLSLDQMKAKHAKVTPGRPPHSSAPIKSRKGA